MQPAASPAIFESLRRESNSSLGNRSTCAYTCNPALNEGALLATKPGFRVHHTFPWLLSLCDRASCSYSRVPNRIVSASDPV